MRLSSEPEQIYKRLICINWIFSFLATIAGFIWGGFRFGISVAMGAGLIVANIWQMERVVRKFLLYQMTTKKIIGKILIKYFIRFFITALIISFLIAFRYANPLGLLTGVLMIALSLFVITAMEIFCRFFEKT